MATEPIMRAASAEQAAALRQRTASDTVLNRLRDYYSAQYGSEFAALIHTPHDDFDF